MLVEKEICEILSSDAWGSLYIDSSRSQRFESKKITEKSGARWGYLRYYRCFGGFKIPWRETRAENWKLPCSQVQVQGDVWEEWAGIKLAKYYLMWILA